MRKTKGFLGSLLVVLTLGFSQLVLAADVTGTWTMMVETQAGSGSPTFTLTQKGEAITGTYKGQLGEAPVTGTLKGSDLLLEFKVDLQGQSLTVTYTGKVDGNSASGTVQLGQFAQGTFKGTKS
jgi:hypothetical protein